MKIKIPYPVIFLLLMLVTGYSKTTGDIKIAVIRAEFITDNSEGTTGDGTFLLEEQDFCTGLQVDPPPHNAEYFLSHLKAVDNYFRTVSRNKFGIDIENSRIFPENSDNAYSLGFSMDHYHPFEEDSIHDKRLTELFNDAVVTAYNEDGMDLDAFDIIMVVHPGTGQDFELPFLDPTPEDIPSAFIDPEMISDHLGLLSITVGNANITSGIILPETQNLLLYEDTAPIFEGSSSPCDYQYSLTGTMALMIGFHEGLPPLWNTESGRSMVGVFSLMDQGSNNLSGLVPAIPDAWTRIHAGWDEPVVAATPGDYEISIKSGVSEIIKVPINGSEYFLIENRLNWFRDSTGIPEFQVDEYESTGSYSSELEIMYNEAEAVFDNNGVMLSPGNYDTGLPGSGVLIWHINEGVIQSSIGSYAINNSTSLPGVDLEEADGAQDIGYPSIHLFTDPSRGYFGDLWYSGNLEYVRANPDFEGADPVFGPNTIPNTNTFYGSETSIRMTISGAPDSSVTLSLNFGNSIFGAADTTLNILTAGDINNDGNDEILGFGDSLWWSPINDYRPVKIPFDGADVSQIVFGGKLGVAVISELQDSITARLYSYDFDLNNLKLIYRYALRDQGRYFISGRVTDEEYTLCFEHECYFIRASGPSSSTGIGLRDQVTIIDHNGARRVYSSRNDGLLLRDHGTGNEIDMNFPILSLSAGDLDLNGQAEICAIDSKGQIHVLNKNLTYVSGFPTGHNLATQLLIGDILGGTEQEIVTKQADGGIVITSSIGKQLRVISDPPESDLRALGLSGGYAYIVTRAGVYSVRNETGNGLHWTHPFGSRWNIREYEILKDPPENGKSTLLDLNKTYAYPNPSKEGRIVFRITSGIATTAMISVYDLSGSMVWSQSDIELDGEGLPNEIIWNTSNVESGVYIARITGKNSNKTVNKILKIAVIQ